MSEVQDGDDDGGRSGEARQSDVRHFVRVERYDVTLQGSNKDPKWSSSSALEPAENKNTNACHPSQSIT